MARSFVHRRRRPRPPPNGLLALTHVPAYRLESSDSILAGCGGLLSLFDQQFDFLATSVADHLVKSGTVAVARCFAAFLAADLADFFIEIVAVACLRGRSAFLADSLKEFGA